MENLKLKTVSRITTASPTFFGLSTASGEKVRFRRNKTLQLSCFLFLSIWCWTLIDVADLMNWSLENIPVFLLVASLIYSYRNYQFSDLSYILIFVFLSLHIYGAKFIYAHNPFGEWLQQEFGSSRNNYDRIVHFCFGMMLSYPMREVCLNRFNFSQRVSVILPIIVCLALSALYEIVEGVFVGIFFPEQGPNFLGHQGDEWDAQKDMGLAMLGSIFFAFVIAWIKIRKRNSKNEIQLR